MADIEKIYFTAVKILSAKSRKTLTGMTEEMERKCARERREKMSAKRSN